MSYTTKNYAAHGGEEWVIGGKLTILEGAVVEGLNTGSGFTPAANVPASTATTIASLKEDHNTLLAVLKAAGLMAADAPAESEGDGEDDEEDAGEGGGDSNNGNSGESDDESSNPNDYENSGEGDEGGNENPGT